jgi:hypothetical protein
MDLVTWENALILTMLASNPVRKMRTSTPHLSIMVKTKLTLEVLIKLHTIKGM